MQQGTDDHFMSELLRVFISYLIPLTLQPVIFLPVSLLDGFFRIVLEDEYRKHTAETPVFIKPFYSLLKLLISCISVFALNCRLSKNVA